MSSLLRPNRVAAAVSAMFVMSMPAVVMAADAESEVIALEQQCEVAREAKLKPMRDAEIARCKTEQGKDAAYCERYWSDYGAASRRPNGTVKPRLFDDLPECVRAFEARKKLNMAGK
jgi:hypothetical protein